MIGRGRKARCAIQLAAGAAGAFKALMALALPLAAEKRAATWASLAVQLI